MSSHGEQRDRPELAERRKGAPAVAFQAADLLREHFAAVRVVVFRSLVHEGCSTRWSDVDLAAWGLCSDDTFPAMGAVQDLDPGITINLVDVGVAWIEVEGAGLRSNHSRMLTAPGPAQALEALKEVVMRAKPAIARTQSTP